MTMTEWAENEVKIACERCGNEDEEMCRVYTTACYESALKAYKAMAEDDHSGMSWCITSNILEHLIRGLPLTPIEDTDDIWSPELIIHDDRKSYQCKRKSSFWKDVYNDGHIEYQDTDRIRCTNVNDPGVYYTSGFVREIVEEHPEIGKITMPYFPQKPIKVYCEDFLCDEKNGDYDTQGIFYAIKPDGTRVEINRFFTESGNDNNPWREITKEEYEEMKARKIK